MNGFKSLPKMQCFKEGGSVKSKPVAKCSGGKMKEGGKADLAQDKAVVKKAFAMHDKQEHKGEKTDLSKLKKGGRTKKSVGTVKKFNKGGSVTNVYEAKKGSGDKDNIKKTKAIKSEKATSPSAAKKVKNTTAKFCGGKSVKKMAVGGNVSAPADVKDPQALTDKIALEENTADANIIPNAYKAVKRVGKQAIKAAKDMFGGQGTVSDAERSNIAKKKGGKVKKYAEGGAVLSDEEKAWLGGADATDPFILARMRSALGEKKPQSSYIPNANPAMDNRDVGTQTPVRSTDIARLNEMAQGQGVFPEGSPALPTSIAPPARRAPTLPAGPSADDRLRMRNARPYVAPNVEQDSGLDYPVKPGFFTATPGQQATQFNKGVQARKNFAKRFGLGGAPSTSFDNQLAAINKPKV